MSISNIYYEVSGAGILTDGYITRIPESAFYGGGGGLGNIVDSAYKPDVAAVSRVLDALGGPAKVTLLLTGHGARYSHHSFDTPTWSRLTGSRILGSRTTCFQARAERAPPETAAGWCREARRSLWRAA